LAAVYSNILIYTEGTNEVGPRLGKGWMTAWTQVRRGSHWL